MFKQSDATLNRDPSKDLFIIGHCEAFKHKVHIYIINIIIILLLLWLNRGFGK
jgi:hypothetical protein